MKTLRQEDGRQLGTTSRKWIYMPTTSYPRAFMRHLICVSYVVLSAHFSNSSPATVPENKEALIFEVFMCGCIQTVEWYLRIDNWQLFKKDTSGPSMHLSHCHPRKKKRRNQTRAAGWKPPKLINYRCISFLPGAFSGWFMNFNSLCPHHWLPKLSFTKSWDQMHILFFFSPHFFNSLAVSLLNFNTAVFLYRCTSSQTSTSI